MRHISWNAETPEKAEASFRELEDFVATDGAIGPDTRSALQRWLVGVKKILHQLTLAHTAGGAGLYCLTTSRGESVNFVVKAELAKVGASFMNLLKAIRRVEKRWSDERQ